ncbi:hypothetical protein LDVICp175 [lymphocystis disease virus-China]|uniref:Uncharacterized protein n=1 Tax=lymphocystis disease virus-China TaxID=256729 RepID=Q677T8_9VIRU|nr:hypothetical protein LDVICp175 [lymphocystis disease virus-China]AAU11019.1 hypothetical protein [lymphocystis disease virus-China]
MCNPLNPLTPKLYTHLPCLFVYSLGVKGYLSFNSTLSLMTFYVIDNALGIKGLTPKILLTT